LASSCSFPARPSMSSAKWRFMMVRSSSNAYCTDMIFKCISHDVFQKYDKCVRQNAALTNFNQSMKPLSNSSLYEYHTCCIGA
jgi:hypothetical protein